MRLLRKNLRPAKLIKKNGMEYTIQVNLQSSRNEVLTAEIAIPFEKGDIIEREVANSTITERFVITKVNRSDNFISMIICEEDKMKEENQISDSNTYNFNVTGGTNNFRLNSVENGTVTNIYAGIEPEQFFTMLREALSETNTDIIEAVNAMEATVGKRSFLEKYGEFMQVAASHMTLITPFLPQLQ